MLIYFGPLRRKVGAITLLLACVVLAGWMRSFTIKDKLWIPLQTSIRTATICRGYLLFCYGSSEIDGIPNRNPHDVWLIEQTQQSVLLFKDGEIKKMYVVVGDGSPTRFRWTTSATVDGDVDDPSRDSEMKQLRIWGVVSAAKNRIIRNSDGSISLNERIVICTVHFWSIVIPLTVLSAWLLLSRSRTTKPVPALERQP